LFGWFTLKGSRKFRSVVNPEDFVREAADRIGLDVKSFQVPEIAVIVYGESLFSRLLKLSNAEKPGIWLYKQNGSFPVRFGKVGDKDVALTSPGVGAPAVVVRMEELIACGGKKFILAGWAGSLQKNVNIGDFVVGTDAIRDEGTSHHYLPKNVKASASKEISEALMKSCHKHGVTFHSGTVWTIDAPYRETRRKVLMHQRRGVLCVEMETAAILSLAIYRKVMAGSILIISDSLAELRWSGFDAQKLRQAEAKAAHILLDAIKAI